MSRPKELAAGGLGEFYDFQIYTPKEYYTPSGALKDIYHDHDSKFEFHTPPGADIDQGGGFHDSQFDFYTPDAEHEIGHFYVGDDTKFGYLGRVDLGVLSHASQ